MVIKTAIRLFSLGLIATQATLVPMAPYRGYVPGRSQQAPAYSHQTFVGSVLVNNFFTTQVGQQNQVVIQAPQQAFYPVGQNARFSPQVRFSTPSPVSPSYQSAPVTPRIPTPNTPRTRTPRARSVTPGQEKQGVTPISWAAGLARLDDVKNFLEQGANPNIQDENGKTGLSWAAGKPKKYAAGNTYEQIVALLLHNPHCQEKTVNPTHSQYDSNSELCTCANPNLRDNKGKTPLGWAAGEQDCIETVKLLLAAGANPNSGDNTGQTPLCWAASRGLHEIAVELLKAGAEVNMRSHMTGKTALQWAAGNGYINVVTLLLTYGADPLATDNAGYSALYWAQRSGGKAVEDALTNAIAIHSQQTPALPQVTEPTLQEQLAGFDSLLNCLKDHEEKPAQSSQETEGAELLTRINQSPAAPQGTFEELLAILDGKK